MIAKAIPEHIIAKDSYKSAKVVDIDIKYVEEVLIKSGEYALDGKKGLLKEGIEVAVIDTTEIGIERPKKNSESGKSAKKKRHTIKALVVVEMRSKQVICTAIGNGKKHDFSLF